MNALMVLVSGLGLLVFLMLVSFICILWGLKQLYTIGAQNETIISFLYQISVTQWDESHAQTGLAEDMVEAPPVTERKLRLHRQEEDYPASGPQLAGLK
jgi:hypothetical protein